MQKLVLIVAALGLLILFASRFLAGNRNTVVIYVSHDQDYSEPILADFENETGITVKAVYDTEASKTVGLTNRLIAEKDNPQADVFWNNEVTRTIQLKQEGVLDQYYPANYEKIDATHKDAEGFWTGFAARARVLVVNNEFFNVGNLDIVPELPNTLEELVAKKLKDQVTIADARFGTTTSHLAALYSVWGKEKTENYLLDLKENGLNVAQSNGQTRDKVVNGEMAVGFTDTDDANDAITEGADITQIYPDQGENEIGTLVIPNTAMLIKGAPNIKNAKILIDYLISGETEAKLARAKSAQMPLLPDVETPDNVKSISEVKAMEIVWEDVFRNIQDVLDFFEANLIN